MVKKLTIKKIHRGLWARLAVFMAVILMTGMQVNAQQTPVSYLSPVYKTAGVVTSGIDHWETLSCTNYTLVDSEQDNWGTENTESWYVVNSDVTINGNVTCIGNVHLILMDGYTLNTATIVETGGDGNSFTIYAQSTVQGTMGVLNATGGDMAAGIGGGEYGSGSNITINGGSVTANGGGVYGHGGTGAGIGGGGCQFGQGGSGSNITINGGSVTANGGSVKFDGGTGAGIGGGGGQYGQGGSGSNITINGGSVTANGGSAELQADAGAGIGGGGGHNGQGGSGSNITINGGSVTANGGSAESACAAGIGGGNNGSSEKIYVADNIVLKADNNNPPTTVIEHSSGTDVAQLLSGQYATAIELEPVSYLSPVYKTVEGSTMAKNGIDHWETLSCTNYTPVASDQTTWGTEGNDSWYVVNESLEISNTVTCAGNVHLILMNNCTLTVNGPDSGAGICVTDDDSFAVYAQSTAQGTMGVLNATGGDMAAGIGGGVFSSGSNITINGGSVTANVGTFGAGIGGGTEGPGSNITINGGSVTATGGVNSAGIGGGMEGSGSGITINGGSVTANGGFYGAGIGGGMDGSGSRIYVADNILLKADNNNPPTTVIEHSSGTDVAQLLSGQYATAIELEPVCINTATGVQYASVQGAIDAITEVGTIKLLGNTVEDVVITDKNIVLYLNGKTITNEQGYAITVNSGSLTVNDTITTAGLGGVTGNIALNGGTTTISNGKFNGTITKTGEGTTLNLNGGKYSADPTQFLDIDHAAKEITDDPYIYEVVGGDDVVCNDGKHSFTTVQHAVNFQTEAATITMVKDATENVTIAQGKEITLDLNGIALNGKTVTPKTDATYVIYNSGTLSLIDGSTAKTGKITGATDGGVGNDGGTLYMYAGTITGLTCGSVNGGDFYMYGGTIKGCTYGSVNEDGNFYMYGGTITGNRYGVFQVGAMTIGGTAKITGNVNGEDKYNLFLPDDIFVFTVATGEYAPTTGMMVGVSISQWESGDIVTVSTENTTDYSQYFVSDNAANNFVVYADKDDSYKLKITDDVKVMLTAEPIDGGTLKIYNAGTGEEIADPEHVHFGTEVTIKAIPENGIAFKGWYDKTTGDMLSGKYEYTFVADKNYYLEARFTDQVIWIRVKK